MTSVQLVFGLVVIDEIVSKSGNSFFICGFSVILYLRNKMRNIVVGFS